MTASLKEKNNTLSQELETSRTKLNAATTELEEMKKFMMTIDQKNKLEEEKDKQAEEIKSLKAQLSDAQKENKKLKGGIFGMTFEPSKGLILSRNLYYYNVVLAGLLTGRHEEEVSGFRGDMLKELSIVHERAWKAMRSMAKALLHLSWKCHGRYPNGRT